MAEGAVKSVWFPITKTVDHDDGTVTVRGKLSSEAVDFDDQIVDRGLMKRLLPKYMQGWKNIRVNHDGRWPAGKAIDLEWDDDGDPVLTARVVEPDAVRLVREGVLQGFSVNIAQPKIRPDPKARRGRIYDGREISESSLVDRPSNPEAAFDVIKAAGWDGAAVPTGWLSSDTARDRGGNVRDPAADNSGDFDSLGDPVLQPAHVRSNAADISVVTMDTRGAVVQVGDEQYLVPYNVESDGDIHWGEPERVPNDPRALPLTPAQAARQTSAGKGAEAMGASYALTPEEGGAKAVWSTAYVDELPDSAFAYISPGGKVKDGRTEPRDLRHLPIRDEAGKLDAPHIRDALARLDQTDIPAAARAEARRKIEDAAREAGIEVAEPATAKVTDIREAAAKAAKDRAHCPECGKMVKCAEKVREEKAPGGKHAIYKGECGHLVHRFERDEEPVAGGGAKETEGAKTTEAPKGADGVPTGLGPKAGEAKGDTAGERPPHTDPAERKENDLVTRMRSALDEYAANVRADLEGKPGAERGETAALQKLWHDVGAALAIQRQEAKEPEAGADPKAADPEGGPPDGVRGQHDEGQLEKVADAILKSMGFSRREVAKAARGRRKEGLREAIKRLGQHIEEIPDDPLEHHRADSPKGAFGTGAQRQPGDAPDANDGGPAPADSRSWRERIREDIADVDDLMRDIDESEGELVKDSGRPGRLQRDGSPAAPGRKPTGAGDMTLDAGDGGEAPARDTREIPKGAGMGPDAIAEAIAKGAAIGAEQAAKAVQPLLESLTHRLGVVEHMTRPPRPPVNDGQVAEPAASYATPWQETSAVKGAREHVGELWNAMPTRDADAFLAKMIEFQRRGVTPTR